MDFKFKIPNDMHFDFGTGDKWVTIATFEAYTEAQATVIHAISDDVESLKTWKTETVTPFIESTTQSISDIEDALAGIDLSDLDGNDPNSWKSTVNSAISALQAAVTALQSNAVTSTAIRTINAVQTIPQEPVSTVLYVVDGGTP